MKKISIIICVAMLIALYGCSPSKTAITVNGRAVDASEYTFYLMYNRAYAADESYQYTKADLEAARAAAIDQIITNEVIAQQCKKNGVKLDDQQKASIDEGKEQLITELGGKYEYLKYLESSYLTDRGYDKFQKNSYMLTALQDFMAEEAGISNYSEEQLRKFFAENYIKVKYIRFSTVNENGEPVSELDNAAIFQLATAVYTQINEATDFNALINRYNDDLGMDTEGVVISRLDSENSPYYTRAFELADKQIDGVIKADDGYYIIQRLAAPVGYYEENEEFILLTASDLHFAQSVAKWKNDASIKLKSVVNEINFSNYKDYIK